MDDEKRSLNEKLLNETDPDEAVRLHDEMTKIADELSEAEERWMELSEE